MLVVRKGDAKDISKLSYMIGCLTKEKSERRSE